MGINSLVIDLKNNGQDHEFYPTTDEIIFALTRDMKRSGENADYYRSFKASSILDIGAGNGKVLNAIRADEDFSNIDLYAIEKSQMLREILAQDIYIIGTDFYEQSLLDKHIDVTFCNPPYSDYEQWAIKIIRESASERIYLVIPTRWKDCEEIKEALKYRDAKYKIVGEYSFEDAEDRTARAIVNLVRIELSPEKEDAFDRLFNEEFADLKAKFVVNGSDGEEKKQPEEESKFTSMVTGEGYVEALVNMYNEELKNIRRNYELVSQLDSGLLREFDVSPEKVLKCLKERTSGLKSLYWNELIGRMGEITSRIISKRREKLFSKLRENGHVDFTESNIYAVVLWILKNAGDHIDEQVIQVYEELISKANCHNYKSNQRVFENDNWRYNDEKPTHVYLDYRIVVSRWGAIKKSWSGKEYEVCEYTSDSLKDILTIANNLCFRCSTTDNRLYHWHNKGLWAPGQPQEFRCIYKGSNMVLLEVKLHLNGNMHIRMNQKFALALNVEYGRLKGWIHSKEQAGEELMDSGAAEYFKTNLSLLQSPFLMLEQKAA